MCFLHLVFTYQEFQSVQRCRAAAHSQQSETFICHLWEQKTKADPIKVQVLSASTFCWMSFVTFSSVSFQPIPANRIKNAACSSNQSVFLPSMALTIRLRAVSAGASLSAWADCSKSSKIKWTFCFWDSEAETSVRDVFSSRHTWSSWQRGKESCLKATAVIIILDVTSVPLTTRWRELRASRSSRTFVSCWSREDFVPSGRAASRWKCFLSASSSTERKKRDE